MKTRLLAFLVSVARPFAALYYAAIKLLRPPRHKVTLISRQSDTSTVDFTLLANDLAAQDRTLKIKILCCSDDTRAARFAGHLRQTTLELWHIANSRAVVLDTYSPAISYFPQRKNLYVLQMWHALGAFKRFSWQALDTPGGRDSRLARALRMHAGYSMVLTGGADSVEAFRHAFRTPRSRITPLPLPRVDILRDPDPNRVDHLIAAHPEFYTHSPLILYAPTFRDTPGQSVHWLESLDRLERAARTRGAQLILKTHFREKDGRSASIPASDHLMVNPPLDILDLITLADHVITDYSAIAFEAAVAGKPLWFYLPDYQDYRDTRGLNVEPPVELPAACFEDADALMDALLRTPLPSTEQEAFMRRYVQMPANPSISAAKQIARLVMQAIQ